jgi:hypothetical protein
MFDPIHLLAKALAVLATNVSGKRGYVASFPDVLPPGRVVVKVEYVEYARVPAPAENMTAVPVFDGVVVGA